MKIKTHSSNKVKKILQKVLKTLGNQRDTIRKFKVADEISLNVTAQAVSMKVRRVTYDRSRHQ